MSLYLSLSFTILEGFSIVAVYYRALMISGSLRAVFYFVALWGVIRGVRWRLLLIAFLAISDIVGEFVAQGTLSPKINVSILVAIALLLLCILSTEISRK